MEPSGRGDLRLVSRRGPGRSIAELIVPESFRAAHRRGLRRYLETGETRVSGQRLELGALHRDGGELEIELTISPMKVGGETVFNAFLRDITARREAEREVRRLAAIVETSEDAIVSGSIDGTVATWNAGAERLYGYTAEEMIGQPITRLLPSGDFSQVGELRERLLLGGRVRDFETRELHKDGHTIDVSVSMSPLTDESGEVIGVASIARDVGERKGTERALIEAWERFHGAFVNAPIGMALVGLDGTFLTANRAFCELVGRSEREMAELGFQGVTHPDDLDADLELVARVLDGEIERFQLEKRYVRPDGSIVWGLLCVSVVRDPAGEPLHFIGQVQDITARKDAEEELRRYSDHLNELALQDPLTGLRNYRDFHAALDRELERGRRHGGEFSVVLVDVEGFADVNRARGPVEGDHLLREVGRAVAGACRASDLAARIGGDKLALLLPETGEQGAGGGDRTRPARGRRSGQGTVALSRHRLLAGGGRLEGAPPETGGRRPAHRQAEPSSPRHRSGRAG
ncbi:MAG: PAS domain S-box protein [Actinomycetota bacterium]|nr:PAS domain S-box protein [Actinomycetota bacterium]